MTKFIRVTTITNLDVMIRTSAIFTIAKSDMAKHVFITAEDACGNREQFIVEHSMDEIQAMIDGEIDLVQRKPVRQPKFDDGQFTL